MSLFERFLTLWVALGIIVDMRIDVLVEVTAMLSLMVSINRTPHWFAPPSERAIFVTTQVAF